MFKWVEEPDDITDRTMDGILITARQGFVAGTCVASNLGWKPVEDLCIGDKVLTFDNDMQRLTDIQRETVHTAFLGTRPSDAPLFVPRGALENRVDLWLMPDQGVMIEDETLCDRYGDPFAVVPAGALDGVRGIERRKPPAEFHVTVLSFADDQILYAEGGLLCFCPRPRQILLDRDSCEPSYNVLSVDAARTLLRNAV